MYKGCADYWYKTSLGVLNSSKYFSYSSAKILNLETSFTQKYNVMLEHNLEMIDLIGDLKFEKRNSW